MAQTHTYGQTLRFREDSETTLVTSSSEVVSGVGEINFSATESPASETLYAFDVGFSSSELSIYALSTQDVSIFTNAKSGGAYDDTFVLTANEPFYWKSSSGSATPLSNSIISIAVDNNGTSSAEVVFKVIYT